MGRSWRRRQLEVASFDVQLAAGDLADTLVRGRSGKLAEVLDVIFAKVANALCLCLEPLDFAVVIIAHCHFNGQAFARLCCDCAIG